MIDWISVKDRLPVERINSELGIDVEVYLVYDAKEEALFSAFYRHDARAWDCPDAGWLLNVTHWAEINLPDGGKDEV